MIPLLIMVNVSEKAIKAETFEFGYSEIINDWGKTVWKEVRKELRG